MNNKYKNYHPLRVFSWSHEEEKTTEQLLVENTVMEWYASKHRKVSEDEINFINSIEIQKCPFCNSTHIIKNGHRNDGMQRYRCITCNKRFIPLTNTIFDSHKIPISEWIEYLLHLFEYHSIKSSAYDNRNVSSTGTYWLRKVFKVFKVLKGIQDDIMLDGTIYLDETYIPKIQHETVTKDGKKLRGISRNKLGVCVATNGKTTIYLASGTSKPSKKSTLRTYGKHIIPGSTIIHDEEHSHKVLIDKLNLTSIVYPASETKGLKDEDNPLYKVNHQHTLLKKFMKEHGGFDRKQLQDWMNLFCFIQNGPTDRYDKVLTFLANLQSCG
jgi:transposase-like protein